MKKAIVTIISIISSLVASAQTSSLTGDLGGIDVLSVAHRANNYFMDKWSDATTATNAKKHRENNLWTRGVYFEGLFALYGVDPQQRYMDYVDKWGTYHHWNTYGYTDKTVDADCQCCGQGYFMRYFQVGGKEKYVLMQKNFDNQIAADKHDAWTWIDAIQMAMPTYAMLSKITNDPKYIDFAMKSYIWTRDTCGGGLFNRAQGLWFRDANFVPPYKEPDGKNCYWSRGNGWVYAALCRVMDQLSPKSPYYKMLKADYLLMSKALLSIQREDGFWNPSLVSTNFEGPELSGTSLFLYGMAWGMNHKLLKTKEYLPAADKAWKAMASCVHSDGFLGYVQGSGDRPGSSQPCTYNREPDFDDYGLGCFLLGVSEYYKLLKK